MGRTTILRYAKYSGCATRVMNKTIMHGFRLHSNDGVGVDSAKSPNNFYFVWQQDNTYQQVSHDNRNQVIKRFKDLHHELKTKQDNNPRLIPFDQKYAKNSWVMEVVKTYSPPLYQEWDIAEILKVDEIAPPDYLEQKFNIKSEGYYLNQMWDKNKLDTIVKKLIAEETELLKAKLGTDKGMIGATCHLDERNIHLHMYFMPVTTKDRIESSKYLNGREDFQNRQKAFWEWSKTNIDSTIESYRPKWQSNTKHKSFKLWHAQQKQSMNLELLNLTKQLTSTQQLLQNLQQQRAEILSYLALDLTPSEKMQLQNLLMAIENVQDFKLRCTLALFGQQEKENEEQLAYWQNQVKDLTLTLMPLLQKAQLLIREQKT